jgi:hypothetical protein
MQSASERPDATIKLHDDSGFGEHHTGQVGPARNITGGASVFRLPMQDAGDGAQRRIRPAAIGASGLGEVGTAAAALAAKFGGADAYEIDRI